MNWKPFMKFFSRLTLVIICAMGVVCAAQEEVSPTLKGYVTHGVTLQSFDVNGWHVQVGPKTEVGFQAHGGGLTQGASLDALPFLGEAVDLYGKKDQKSLTVRADKIILHPTEPGDVEGEGMIDAVLAADIKEVEGSRVVRADGYLVLIGPKITVSFASPTVSGMPITTNMWVSFHGRQRDDGVVVADRVRVKPNTVSGREDKLLTKADYDPQAVDKDAKQGTASKIFKGIDPKQIPPYDDPVMQKRVETIGEKLIPKYQRDLPGSDETKLSFEFQVVDMTKWKHDARTLPNGIILVPKQVVERLQNDSQLAAVLADNIACALEKQTYRAYPGEVGRTAVSGAGAVAGAFVPGLSLLTSVGTTGAEARAERLREEQSGRVSLFLMKDAGFQVDQAPLAWWLLASGKPKEVTSITMPRRTTYLYDTLARSWHTPQ